MSRAWIWSELVDFGEVRGVVFGAGDSRGKRMLRGAGCSGSRRNSSQGSAMKGVEQEQEAGKEGGEALDNLL